MCMSVQLDCLCGLVVRVPGYRSRGPGFHSQRHQIFWEVAGLEPGPLSLVSTTEQLHGRNSSGSGLKNWEYRRGDPLRWPRNTLYPQKLAITSPTHGGHSVGIVRLRTKAKEFVLFVCTAYAGIILMSIWIQGLRLPLPRVVWFNTTSFCLNEERRKQNQFPKSCSFKKLEWWAISKILVQISLYICGHFMQQVYHISRNRIHRSEKPLRKIVIQSWYILEHSSDDLVLTFQNTI
jgi:hypothetical protein